MTGTTGKAAIGMVGLGRMGANLVRRLMRDGHDCYVCDQNPDAVAALDDEAVIDSLCKVRGIGPWTAQMHLIFAMGRPDVMPATDLGIQKGVQLTYGLKSLPKPDDVFATTRHLAPYRSVASWYLWRVVDD